MPHNGAVLPFLLLSTRAEDDLARQEHQAVARHMGVLPERLVQWRLEAAPMPGLDLSRWAGVLIGGSPFTVSDPNASKDAVQKRVEAELATVLDAVVAADFPTLGLCYGMGVLGVHQQAMVDTTHGEQLSAPVITLTEAGAADPLLQGLPRRFRAWVGHKEAVATPSPGMTVLAGSAACPVQLVRVGRHVRAAQFHPELDAEGLAARVAAYAHHGYFAPEEAAGIVTAARTTDVSAAHRLLARFAALYG